MAARKFRYMFAGFEQLITGLLQVLGLPAVLWLFALQARTGFPHHIVEFFPNGAWGALRNIIPV